MQFRHSTFTMLMNLFPFFCPFVLLWNFAFCLDDYVNDIPFQALHIEGLVVIRLAGA